MCVCVCTSVYFYTTMVYTGSVIIGMCLFVLLAPINLVRYWMNVFLQYCVHLLCAHVNTV